MSERDLKLARVRAILESQDAQALALTTPGSLAWLLDGARATVTFGGPPVFSAVVDRAGRVEVTAFANEVERLRAEELDDRVTVRTVAWHEQLPVADALPEAVVESQLRAARAALLPEERERYARLGAEVAVITTKVLRGARPEQSEFELAGRLAAELLAAGAEPVVLMVAGSQRLGYRHPVPTDAVLGDRAMVVVGARRAGLIVNLTRWIVFDGPEWSPNDEAMLEVEADAFAASRPGRELRQVLADISDSYTRHGFGRDGWLGHHQGGPTGYFGRDPRATPAARDLVVSGQAFAWNPSAPGAKVEDTVIIDNGVVQLLTVDPDWPTIEVHGLARPRPLTPETPEGAR